MSTQFHAADKTSANDCGRTCRLELGQNLNVTALVTPQIINGPTMHQSEVVGQIFDQSGQHQNEQDGKYGHCELLGSG